MANRFSVTEKWIKDNWFSALSPIEKLVFLFWVDNCDNAGFLELNERVQSFLIGIEITEYLKAIEELSKCFIRSKDGRKIFLKNFLQHQKNVPLNKDNNAHKQIILLIDENVELFDYEFKQIRGYEGANKPLIRGLGNSNSNGIIWDVEKEKFLNDENWRNQFMMAKNIKEPRLLKELLEEFIADLELKLDFKPSNELKSHFTNDYNKKQREGNLTVIEGKKKMVI